MSVAYGLLRRLQLLGLVQTILEPDFANACAFAWHQRLIVGPDTAMVKLGRETHFSVSCEALSTVGTVDMLRHSSLLIVVDSNSFDYFRQ
jgi:hypothetical protein